MKKQNRDDVFFKPLKSEEIRAKLSPSLPKVKGRSDFPEVN